VTITEITWQENEIIMNKLDDDEGTSGAIAPTFTTAGVVIKRKHSQVGGSANIQCDEFSKDFHFPPLAFFSSPSSHKIVDCWHLLKG